MITNVDIKSVQGDNGQNQAKMVTDTYSFIIDSNRQRNAALIEEQFFKDGDGAAGGKPDTDAQIEQMVKLLTGNPGTLKKLMDALPRAQHLAKSPSVAKKHLANAFLISRIPYLGLAALAAISMGQKCG